MGPRLADPEVKKAFAGSIRGEREALTNTLSRVVRVVLRGSAADVLVLNRGGLWASGEPGAPRDGLERAKILRATEIGRDNLQARYAALDAEYAKSKGRNKALGADLAALSNAWPRT